MNIMLTLLHATMLFVRHHSLAAVTALIVVEDCGIPIPLPGNVLLMVLGYRISTGHGAYLDTLAAVTAATWLGSFLLYAAALKFGRPAMVRFGRYIGLEPHRVVRIETWLQRFGPGAVLVGRSIPGLRNPTSAVSGTFGISRSVFLLYSGISGLIWSSFWLIAGAVVGRKTRFQIGHISAGQMLLGIACFAAFFLAVPLIGAMNAYRQRRRARRMASLVSAGEGECVTITRNSPPPTDDHGLHVGQAHLARQSRGRESGPSAGG